MKVGARVSGFISGGLSDRTQRLSLAAWLMADRSRWQTLDILLAELDTANDRIKVNFAKCMLVYLGGSDEGD